MKNQPIIALIATLTFLSVAPVRASTKAAAQVKAAKGPVQITLRLQKTKVKVEKSLWYKLELKNIGKKKMQVHDRIFKDPYAMHVNSRLNFGIYLEVIGPDGERLTVRPGNYQQRYDWEGPEGQDYWYSPEEKKEIKALVDGWKKSGMTAQQQSLATSAWDSELRSKKNREELSDPARQLWLEPGASTATFSWADRGPKEYPGRSADDESLRKGYTQLWVYWLLSPGKYRIRAVYNHAASKSHRKEMAEKYGLYPEDWEIQVKTPYVEFQVLP